MGLYFLLLLAVGLPTGHSASGGWPIEGPRGVSGSFGEYRPSHLHAGLDLSTFGRIGVPVRSLGSGRVHHLRSSRTGYGNVLYISRDDGFMAVYAHLSAFAPRLEALLPRRVNSLGGDAEGERMEVYPRRTIRIEDGEVIAFTGESGAGLPHIHVELRDGANRPVNPWSHGLIAVEDILPPVLKTIIVEPASPGTRINGDIRPIVLRGDASEAEAVSASGPVRILVSTWDEDGSMSGRLIPYRLEMRADGRMITEIEMDRFSYEEGREVGTLYDRFRTGFGPAEYTFDMSAPDGTAGVKSEGGFFSGPAGDHDIEIILEDASGNRASKGFHLRMEPGLEPEGGVIGEGLPDEGLEFRSYGGWLGIRCEGSFPPYLARGRRPVRWTSLAEGIWTASFSAGDIRSGGRFILEDGSRPAGVRIAVLGRGGGNVDWNEEGIELTIPRGALADETIILITRLSASGGGEHDEGRSGAVTGGDAGSPEAGWDLLAGPFGIEPEGFSPAEEFLVSIRAPEGESGREGVICRYDGLQGRWRYAQDSSGGGIRTAERTYFSPMALIRDSSPPRLEEVSFYPSGRPITDSGIDERVIFVFADELSGISRESVEIWMDGEMMAGRFDPDRDAFISDSPIPTGGHDLEWRVSDRAGHFAEGSLEARIR